MGIVREGFFSFSCIGKGCGERERGGSVHERRLAGDQSWREHNQRKRLKFSKANSEVKID